MRIMRRFWLPLVGLWVLTGCVAEPEPSVQPATPKPLTEPASAQAPVQPAKPAPAMEKVLERIRAFVTHKVAEGFDDEGNVVDQAVALFVEGTGELEYLSFLTDEEGDNYREEDLRPHVERITAEIFQERRREEGQWKDATDCDKLDGAFRELDRQGVVARQNLPCCMQCSLAEISVEIATLRQSGRQLAGYVFYHEQDTSRAPSGRLFLAFGSVEDRKDQTSRVGKRIVEELNRAGLKTQWNGSPDESIVVILEWKKRRFSSCP